MRFTKKIVVGRTTYLFNGNIKRGEEHAAGGHWSQFEDGLSFPAVLTDEQIWFILENLQMFPKPGAYCIVVKDEQPVDLVLEARHDLKFIVNDPGDPSVGIFGGLSEVRIQINPICVAPDDPEVVDFWRQACVDFFDVRQVYTASEFASEQEQYRKLEIDFQNEE